MSNLPISSKYRSTPDKPVDETEREALSRQLNEAFEKGSVDQSDYSAMLDRVFSARTLGELAPVVERLGARATHNEPAMVRREGNLPPGELAPAGMNNATAAMVMKAVSAGGFVIIVLAALILLF